MKCKQPCPGFEPGLLLKNHYASCSSSSSTYVHTYIYKDNVDFSHILIDAMWWKHSKGILCYTKYQQHGKGKKQKIPSTNNYGRGQRRWHSASVNYTPAKAKSLLHSLEQASGCIGPHVNADKTEYICFNQRGDIFTLKGGTFKQVDKFTNLVSSVSSTENDINTRLAKAWTTIDRLSIIWMSDLTDKIKRSFFQAMVVWVLLHYSLHRR